MGFWTEDCDISAARRGQIVQRVLVDGWSAARAADAFDVDERQIVRWVAAYRRDGMASLRNPTAAERMPQRWTRRLHLAMTRFFVGIDPEPRHLDPAPCVELRRGRDDSRQRG